MTTSTEFSEVVRQARAAMEEYVAACTGRESNVTEPSDLIALVPRIDLAAGVTRYFEFIQRSVHSYRGYADTWATLIGWLTTTMQENAGTFTPLMRDAGGAVHDTATAATTDKA